MNFNLTYLSPFGALLEPKSTNTRVSELDVENLRTLFGKHELIVLRGFTSFENAQDFSEYCALWGEVSLWPFGSVLELIEQETPEDHIFDNSYMPLHWDGMYRPQIPEYQIFHCVKAPLAGQGGRTVFSNTILALQSASAEIKVCWSRVTASYQRKMEFYKSKTVSPIITQPDLEFTGISPEHLAAFHQTLEQALYSPDNFYAHEWQTGDLVIADNFSLLHGREAFISKSPRHLQRVHVLSDPPFNNPGLESYE